MKGNGKSDYDAVYKMIKIRGIVIPVEWDEEGNVLSVALSSHDEDEYLIDSQGKGEEFKALMRREVEIRGELREERKKKIVRVKEYNVRPA